MPDKRAFSPSVGKPVMSSFRRLAVAGLVAASAAWLAPGCTDNSGNGQFVPPQHDGAAGATAGAGGGGSGGTGGDNGGSGGATGGSGGGAGTSSGGSGGATGGSGGGTAGSGGTGGGTSDGAVD